MLAPSPLILSLCLCASVVRNQDRELFLASGLGAVVSAAATGKVALLAARELEALLAVAGETAAWRSAAARETGAALALPLLAARHGAFALLPALGAWHARLHLGLLTCQQRPRIEHHLLPFFQSRA